MRRTARQGKERVIMLVLGRQVGQDLVIDGRIVVRVLSVKGRKVRLGVVTSPFAPVDRGEVHRRIRPVSAPDEVSCSGHEDSLIDESS